MTRTSKNGVALAIALALASTSFGSPAAETQGQSVEDVRQHARITTTYGLNPYLRGSAIEVAVDSGVVTLSGRVDEDVSKELAEAVALGVPGVTRVSNDIEVSPQPASGNRAGRRYGEALDDATITTAIRSKLDWSRESDSVDAKVQTRNGEVTLTGSASTAEAKALAGRLASTTRGVSAVENQLVVRPLTSKPSASTTTAARTTGTTGTMGTTGTTGSSRTTDTTDAASTAGTAISDTWITTKVKYTLLYSSNVAGSDISVTTEAGVVSLSGTVDSGAERALAIELARNIKGVNRVDATGLKS
jgi:hyperosmotically inducible periplasmic protein